MDRAGFNAAAPPAKRHEATPLLEVQEVAPPPAKRPKQKQREDQARIRTFPHVRGVWASFLYIPFVDSETFHDLVGELQETIQRRWQADSRGTVGTSLQAPVVAPIDEGGFHISVSRTLKLQLHGIDPLLEQLKRRLGGTRCIQFGFGELTTYHNSSRTRSFLALKVSKGLHALRQLVDQVDSTLACVDQPPFYEHRDLHMSLLSWAASETVTPCPSHLDASNPVAGATADAEGEGGEGSGLQETARPTLPDLDEPLMDKLRAILAQYRHDPDTGLAGQAARVVLKTGHKLYSISLAKTTPRAQGTQ